MTGLNETLKRIADLRSLADQLQATLPPMMPIGSSGGDGPGLAETGEFGSNPGQLRMMSYVPAGLAEKPALVVALHGCTQSASSYDRGSGWSTLAERHGFALLMPEQQQANNPNRCFNWFAPSHTRRDAGEALSIRQMVARMMAQHEIDTERVFVVGLSAGGAMAAALLACYPDVFAGGAIIAGLPFGAASSMTEAFESMAQGCSRPQQELGELVRSASTHDGSWPKLSIWHGSADPIVNAANAEASLAQWLEVHRLAAGPDCDEHDAGGHRRRAWHDSDGEEIIEVYTIANFGHGVPISTDGEAVGQKSAFHLDAGISSTAQIVRFWGLGDDRLTIGARSTLPLHPDGRAARSKMASAARPLAAFGGLAARTRPAAYELRPEAAVVQPGVADPSGFITATLQRAGVLDASPSSGTAGDRHRLDARAVIASALKSVGLLKV